MERVIQPNTFHMPSPKSAAIRPKRENTAKRTGIPQSFRNDLFIVLFFCNEFPLLFFRLPSGNP